MNQRKALYLAGILAPPLYIGTIVAIGRFRSDYGFVPNLISQLTEPRTPYQSVLTATFSAYNFLAVLFAVGLALFIAHVGRSRRLGFAAATLVAVVGISGVIRVGFFPMDPLGAPPNAGGQWHNILAGISTVSAELALLLFIVWFTRAHRHRGMIAYTALAALILIGAIWATVNAISNETPWMGLPEKAGVIDYLLWMFVFAVSLLRWKDA